MLTHLGTKRNCQYKAVNLSEKRSKKMDKIEWTTERKGRWANSNIIPKKFMSPMRNSAVEY